MLKCFQQLEAYWVDERVEVEDDCVVDENIRFFLLQLGNIQLDTATLEYLNARGCVLDGPLNRNVLSALTRFPNFIYVVDRYDHGLEEYTDIHFEGCHGDYLFYQFEHSHQEIVFNYSEWGIKVWNGCFISSRFSREIAAQLLSL